MNLDRNKFKMVKNKKLLYLSLTLLLVSIVLNFPFPHHYPFGEVIFSLLNISSKSSFGLHYVGITSLVLMLGGLILLVNSANKYHVRLVVIAILVVTFIPGFLVSSYQSTFATGIYSVSYYGEENTCDFEMINEKALRGQCELHFINHSNKEVEFTIEFSEDLTFEDDLPIVSLMNIDAPYTIRLGKKESRHVKIETDIDLSNMERHIEGGSATGVNIIMRSKGKSRNL